MEVLLTDREADVMQVLWEHGPSLVAEVRTHLSDELAYTTVLTILRTLEAKGYVAHEEEGRGHRYFAAVQQQAARKSALRHLMGKLFEGSSELLLTHLVSDRRLSAQQLERLREILDGNGNGNGSGSGARERDEDSARDSGGEQDKDAGRGAGMERGAGIERGAGTGRGAGSRREKK
jgi:BlaI family transcriptional regulator, penicillinase repressor